jgi:ribose-phosphate pyrophosphokinase
MIVPGSASQSLAAALAEELGEALAPVEYERFPDGELLARVPASGERAVVVASTDSSDAHVELLQLQDAVRDCEEVVTVLPYMGYARQDEAFEEGDPVSSRAVARALSPGTDRVLTVTPHKEAVCEFFDVPAEPIDAAAHLAGPLPDDLRDPLFLAPDAGATGLAETVRDAHGTGATDHFEKTRLSGTEVEMAPSEVDVDGRDVVLVDDIVATGSTMSEAIGHLHDRDVGRVYVTCVHAMLAGNARTKLARAGVEAVYGTDTLEREVSAVSVAPAVAERL